jgi:hypothetical protein
MLDVIKGIVGAVAPNLGAALGGPIGGAAMTMLSKALGCENNERALQKAIQAATPEQLAEIKKAELDFEARMKELDVDIFALETQDIQDARKHFAKDWTSKAIALVMVGVLLRLYRHDYYDATRAELDGAYKLGSRLHGRSGIGSHFILLWRQ